MSTPRFMYPSEFLFRIRPFGVLEVWHRCWTRSGSVDRLVSWVRVFKKIVNIRNFFVKFIRKFRGINRGRHWNRKGKL